MKYLYEIINKNTLEVEKTIEMTEQEALHFCITYDVYIRQLNSLVKRD